jgi:hypothetical protein
MSVDVATRSTPLKWDVFVAKREGITRDLPPGKEQWMWTALHNSNRVTRKKGMSMSSKPKINVNTERQATSTQAAKAEETSVGNAARDEDIRRRAYEIYLERGEQPGCELDDWLQAKRELESRALSHAMAS